MSAAELVAVHADQTPDAAWHDWRGAGIGGSDISAILGLSNYASPVSLYYEKAGLLDDDEPRPDSQRQRIGKGMEALLASEFHEETGLHVVGTQTWCEHAVHGWARCTTDGFVAESPIISALGPADDLLGTWQAKTDGRFGWPDGVPANIRAQCVWEMGVTGLRHCWLSVMFAGFKVEVFEIPWDAVAAGDWEFMLERADDFWNQHVLAGVVPPMDAHEATTRALTSVYDADPEGMADVDEAGRQLVGAVQVAQRRTKAAEADEARLKNELRSYLGDNTRLIDGWIQPGPRSKKDPKPNVVASWTEQGRASFDLDAFRLRYPRVAAKFTNHGTSRVLRVSKPKEGDQ